MLLKLRTWLFEDDRRYRNSWLFFALVWLFGAASVVYLWSTKQINSGFALPQLAVALGGLATSIIHGRRG